MRPDPWVVDDEHEQLALVAVHERLCQRFPELDPAVVEAAVRLSHAELTGPVRDFVPLLVERGARERLAFAQRDTDSAGASSTPSATAMPGDREALSHSGLGVDEPA